MTFKHDVQVNSVVVTIRNCQRRKVNENIIKNKSKSKDFYGFWAKNCNKKRPSVRSSQADD